MHSTFHIAAGIRNYFEKVLYENLTWEILSSLVVFRVVSGEKKTL
jgi:hypothetical protein